MTTRFFLAAAALCGSVALASPTAPRTAPVTVCPGMIRPAVALTLKNERGQVIPQADDWAARQDPARRVTVRREPGGQWRIRVDWTWYRPVTAQHIRVQEDACGPVAPTPVTIRLQPLPGAPVIRELSLLHASKDGLFVGSWPFTQRVRAFLDAPGTVSRALTWTSSDPAAVTVDQTGTVRSVCGRTPAWATITATLKADPAVQASTRFGRGGGGMVCPHGAVDR